MVSVTPTVPAEDAAANSTPTAYADLTDAVRQLVQLMRDGGIGQLDVRQGDLRISLKSAQAIEVERVVAEPVAVTSPSPSAVEAPPDAGGHVITSPMIGTYYSAPGPNERAFVEIGDRVEVGQTVAIIEAMKIMNEIVSEYAGTVTELIAKNGEAVEYGHPLIRLHE
jgi:acetyl-CoA carboxylase biotin carboxyl carrier protein